MTPQVREGEEINTFSPNFFCREIQVLNEASFRECCPSAWVHIHEARIGKQRMQVEEEEEEGLESKEIKNDDDVVYERRRRSVLCA